MELEEWLTGNTQSEIALSYGVSQVAIHKRIRKQAAALEYSAQDLITLRGNGRGAKYGRQLERGEVIYDRAKHHKGMRWLKARLGDPRPSVSLELSLINYYGPDSYWGYQADFGRWYRLSTNPDDYVWETHAENMSRREYFGREPKGTRPT